MTRDQSRTPTKAPVSADPTRDIAFELLSGVLDRRRTLEDGLERAGGAEPRDRAAAHRLAAAALRRLGSLDAVLEPLLTRAPPEGVKHILRLGAAGLLLLDTPAHAAVGTAVDLARKRKLAPFAGLVNAVLRRVAAQGVAALEKLDGPRLDTPAWLWASWGADARAIAEAHEQEASLDLSLAPGVAAPDGGTVLPTGSVRYPAGTRVQELAGFEGGGFWVQDVAAAMPARLLAVQAGEKVADLCAAPGGKTAQLAAAGAEVFAVERDPARIRRLNENLSRLGLMVDVAQADVLEWKPPVLLDAVLLDAPCSATGTIRRHPDVQRLRRPKDVTDLAAGQEKMLAAAARMLRPGGRLIYAVCSLQPEEGAARVVDPGRFGLRAAPFSAEEMAAFPTARTADGNLRTHPGLWRELGGADGFFAARLVREG
ncbi:MAG: RsmB/NOP family class I SAM-dependent RNA methyltransferase [Janthinobacterium lividum]